MGWPFWIWAGSVSAALLYAVIKGAARLRELERRIEDLPRRSGELVAGQLSAELAEQAQEIQNTTTLGALAFHYPVHLGGWSIDAHLARFLTQQLLEQTPSTILELGAGSSSLLIARCGELLGARWEHLAVDQDAHFLQTTRRLAQLNGLDRRIELRHCPLGPVPDSDGDWYTDLTDWLGERRIDLLLVDGPPNWQQSGARRPALPQLHPHLAEHCTVLVDDANRPDEQSMVAQWLERFPEFSPTRLPEGHGLVILKR